MSPQADDAPQVVSTVLARTLQPTAFGLVLPIEINASKQSAVLAPTLLWLARRQVEARCGAAVIGEVGEIAGAVTSRSSTGGNIRPSKGPGALVL